MRDKTNISGRVRIQMHEIRNPKPITFLILPGGWEAQCLGEWGHHKQTLHLLHIWRVQGQSLLGILSSPNPKLRTQTCSAVEDPAVKTKSRSRKREPREP